MRALTCFHKEVASVLRWLYLVEFSSGHEVYNQARCSELIILLIIFIAAMKELSLTSLEKSQDDISADEVEKAAQRVVEKFVHLSMPDLEASDKIR